MLYCKSFSAEVYSVVCVNTVNACVAMCSTKTCCQTRLKTSFCHTIAMLTQIICDQVCQKGSYTCTLSRHTFHRHLITIPMDQQHMCLILLKVDQSAFTQTSFSSLSDIHKCSDGFQMAPSSLDMETASCSLPHN